MPKPKQPRDEEDEKVCLLSAQQDSPGPHLPSLSNNSSNMSTPTFNGHHHCHPPGGGSSSKETEGGREHEVGAVGGGEKGGGGADAEQEQQGGNKDAREDYLITGEAEKAFFNVCTKRGKGKN